MHLDAKDRRILYEMEYRVRAPVSEIAHLVALPKQTVNYRVNRMKEEGVIRGCRAVVDIHRLGYFSYRVYLRFQNVDPEFEKGLCEKIAALPNLSWFNQIVGGWDMELIFFARNNVHFASLLLAMKKALGEHLRDYVVSPSIMFNHFKRKYLVEKWSQEGISIQQVRETGAYRIDEKDFAILRALSSDASTSYRDIAKKAHLSDNGAKKRMAALEENGIIKFYRAWLDTHKLGRKYYKALVSVSMLDEKLQKEMVSFCLSEPAVIYLVSCFGSWDIEIEGEVKDEEEFRHLLMRFRNRFKDRVGKYETLKVYNEIVMDYFPFPSYADFSRFSESKWVGVSRP